VLQVKVQQRANTNQVRLHGLGRKHELDLQTRREIALSFLVLAADGHSATCVVVVVVVQRLHVYGHGRPITKLKQILSFTIHRVTILRYLGVQEKC
jgi:hypothetical protein